MTRGIFIFIDVDGNAYSTCEFNGEMYPDGFAEDILVFFEHDCLKNLEEFKSFVERFNRRFFGYEIPLVHSFMGEEEKIIDIRKNTTDYLYMINESDSDWQIRDESDELTPIATHSLQIVHYDKLKNVIHRKQDKSCEKKCLLSRSEFSLIIDRLRESKDLAEKVNQLFHDSKDKSANEICNTSPIQISHETLVVFLLKKLLEDKHDRIDYFVNELDYGRKYEAGSIVDENGENIDIRTAEKLYDYITGKNKDV
ncbi:MAG: hypothetical protein ACI4HI_12530 [Lachnospiraceae bacterium]